MPLVEFILPTFERPHPLRMALAALLAQTCSDWKARVMIDGPEALPVEEIVESFNDSRISHWRSPVRYNNWGHNLREMGKNESECQYVVMTGDDNYYTPNFVDELRQVVEKESSPGMIYYDMIHSHAGYTFFSCNPIFNQIDMGAFATRTDLAKQLVLGTDFAADGIFVKDFNEKFPSEKKVKIPKVLFVHN